MGLGSSLLQPQELVAFKKLPSSVPLDSIEIPEKSENRTRTNFGWLITLGIFVLVFIPFMGYTLYHSNIKRIMVGYDQCGNVCGMKNEKFDGISCSGKDMTNLPYLHYTNGHDIHSPRNCVAECPSGTKPVNGVCVSSTSNSDSSVTNGVSSSQIQPDLPVYLNSVVWQTIICALLSILVSMGMLFLFRHATACLVWSIIIICYSAFIIASVAFWVLSASAQNEQQQYNFRYAAIVFTVATIILGIVFIWFRKRIGLVILLLQEATKAVFDMPQLVLIPVFLFFTLALLTAIFVVVTLYVWSAGELVPLNNGQNYYYFRPSSIAIFTLTYNFVIYIWLTQFFIGIQYMTIAGGIAKWYFTREKSYVHSPIATSIYNSFKFHLGTVAMGAWIITMMNIIKTLILSLCKNAIVRAVVRSILEPLEDLIKYLSKNAYIMTALHGQPFVKSGKRAAKILIDNLGNVIAINYIGDFVLGMAKLLIVVITILISMAIFAIAPSAYPDQSNLFPYIFIGIVALISASITFAVFDTTIDSLFICYCEDRLINDGMEKPYYMSRNLMEFIEDSKKVYDKTNN
ncbi:choline transporter-like protein 1 [Sitophilus oryzae]|uniref:Choline transporter-like protein n=1 Tax=Sitophilus oryzae TaxID=7048 RepID=A0A6J2XPX5_SITOR|nr:choline transporter-like protein 1 [Sitophilus oryzae]XP_030752699.1 choline transporter-like protein 1 [Sitophilus oryzae]